MILSFMNKKHLTSAQRYTISVMYSEGYKQKSICIFWKNEIGTVEIKFTLDDTVEKTQIFQNRKIKQKFRIFA